MKKVYDKTKGKIKALWDIIDELTGKIEKLTEESASVVKSNDTLWQEINKPKTVIKKSYEIDINKCYLVSLNSDGSVEVDSHGNEKISAIYSEDNTKTSIVWDETAKCFRLFAVYAPGA